MENAPRIVMPLSTSHTHTIIFLHGRDSIASEFGSETFESQASDGRTLPEVYPTVKWIFPTSKIRNSARFDTEISQWFDIWSVEEPYDRKELQLQGLRESVGEILNIVRSEAELLSPDNIILGGISQGCATAIFALLCGKIRLGGFVGLCSWLPFLDDISTISRHWENKDRVNHFRSILGKSDGEAEDLPDLPDLSGISALETPIFLSHSKDDPIVPIANGRDLCKTLRSLGIQVKWEEYEDGGHWINEPRGVDDIVAFLDDKMPARSHTDMVA